MAFKRVTSKKTNKGYSINVFVQDGSHVKPLIACITRYFAWVKEREEPHRQEKIIKEVEDEARQIGKSTQIS